MKMMHDFCVRGIIWLDVCQKLFPLLRFAYMICGHLNPTGLSHAAASLVRDCLVTVAATSGRDEKFAQYITGKTDGVVR